MSALEQNFDQELISEKVAIVEIPQLYTTRQKSLGNSQGSSQMHSHRDLSRVDLQKLLYGGSDKKKLNNSASTVERIKMFEKQQKEKETRLRTMQNQQEQKELKNCTFRPRINTSYNGQKRTLKEFLESQNNFTKKVQQKKENLKAMLSDSKKEETFRPQIKKYPGTAQRKQEIFERLYKHKQNKQNDLPCFTESFTPQITARGKNIARDVPVTQHLYQDAKRRQSTKMKTSAMYQSKIQPEEKELNLTNEKYAAQKFIKEYYLTLEDLSLTEKAEPLTLQEFLKILEKLGFLNSVAKQTKTTEWELANQAYTFLKQTSPTVRNACVFLMGLVGIYHVNPINFDNENGQNPSPELNLNVSQGRKLQKYFGKLYHNRLYAQTLRKTEIVETYSFKPQINPQSQQLAQTFRSKMLEQTTMMLQTQQIIADLPEDGMISHVELLQLNKLSQQAELRRKRQISEIQSLKECTFKPSIQNMKRSNISIDSYANGNKFEELYQLSKTIRRVDKTKEEMEFEKAEKECTFAPRINKKVVNTVRAEIYAKDIDKTIARMFQGRKQRQAKTKALERPQYQHKTTKAAKVFSNSSDHFKYHESPITQHLINTEPTHGIFYNDLQVQRQQQEIPFLVIDVNLGDQVEQIIVYKDQADKPEILAEGFAQRHGLDPQSKAKLVELLRVQINSILQKIDEESEDQESESS